jgi:uncharacterized protein
LIYVDTSALLKLLRPDEHSLAFASYVDGHADMVSSTLLAIELRRGVLRSAPRALPRVDLLLSRVELIGMEAPVVESASRLPDPMLRTLDAIHVATAVLLRDDIEALVSYDQRMLDAAASHGLPVASPA